MNNTTLTYDYVYSTEIIKCYKDPKGRSIENRPVYLMDFVFDNLHWDDKKVEEHFHEYSSSIKAAAEKEAIIFPIIDVRDVDLGINIMPLLKNGLLFLQKHLGTQILINTNEEIRALAGIIDKMNKFKKYEILDLGKFEFKDAEVKREEVIDKIIAG